MIFCDKGGGVWTPLNLIMSFFNTPNSCHQQSQELEQIDLGETTAIYHVLEVVGHHFRIEMLRLPYINFYAMLLIQGKETSGAKKD